MLLSPFVHDLLVILSGVLWVIHPSIVLGLVFRVIMRRPPTGVALAWLLLIAMAPFVGALIYLLIGERRITNRRGRAAEDFMNDCQKLVPELFTRPSSDFEKLPARALAMEQIGRKVGGFPAVSGNQWQLLLETDEIFDGVIADIEMATTSVIMEFYIWNVGGRADEVLDAIISAARRGVYCCVLIDGLGARPWWKSNQPERLRDAGVNLLPALPPGFMRTLFGRNDLRLHRKIIVVDSRIAWTGSMNLVDPRFFKQDADVGQWIDAMVRMEGPVTMPLTLTMLGDWILERDDSLATTLGRLQIKEPGLQGETILQVLPSGPGGEENAQLQMILAMVDAAEEQIILTTPYFVPPEALLLGLQRARARGVSISLIVPALVDSRLTHFASRSYFDDLVHADIHIFLYQGGLLHTKSISIDDKFSMFGTVNLDMRSLLLNYEVALYVYDTAFTKGVIDMQKSYLAASERLIPDDWRKRSVTHRFCENTLRLISPLL